MSLFHLITDPFADFPFMRRALAACLCLSLGGTPLGVFMTLRRMTLVGDVMSHAILPGVSLSFLMFGLAFWPMALAGLATGIIVALLAVLLTRYTHLKEDAAFALVYLLSMTSGVILISIKGSHIDILNLLFGNILGVDDNTLILMSAVTSSTLFVLAYIYRGLLIECFDPDFMKASTHGSSWLGKIFFILLVMNLISAFQALGTLMALGLMILPSLAARFWTRNIDYVIPLSIAIAILSSLVGLLVSYYHSLPSGPAIVLSAGMICVLSVLSGRYGSIRHYISSAR